MDPINCGDKECSLEHVMLQNCEVYLHTNNTNCNIPCELVGCETELHHFMNCPIWICHSITTPSTTTITTTSTSSTTSTTELTPATLTPLPSIDHHIYLYLSFAANLFLLLILLLILIFKFKKIILRCMHTSSDQNQRRVSLPVNNDQLFTLATSSDDENSLLDHMQNVPLSPTRAPIYF